MKKAIYLFSVLFTLVACTTIKVSKVTPDSDTEGLRYSLGKPFIKVTPNATGDGTYAAELVYLPDENQTYAVSANSFMTKFTFELVVDESGILKKVDMSKSGASPASESVGALGELAKAQLEKQNKEAEEAEKELKEKSKLNKEALDKTLESREQKENELAVAKSELASLEAINPQSDAVKEKVRLVKLNIEKLNLEIISIQKKIDKLQEEQSSLFTAANAPAGKPMAYGPVFFEIRESRDKTNQLSVELVAVSWPDKTTQMKFETAVKATLPAAGEKEPEVRDAIQEATFNETGIAKVTFTFDTKIESIEKSQSTIDDTNNEVSKDLTNIAITGEGSEKITLEIDRKNFGAGIYSITLEFKYKDEKKSEKFGQVVLSLTLK